MKKILGLIGLIVFAIVGCSKTEIAESISQNSDITPTVVSTHTLEITNVPTPTKIWKSSNFLDRFTAMSVLPDHTVWAVSARGTVIQDYLEYRNLASRRIENLGFYLASIHFVSPDDGWMTGSFGQIFHWNGKTWSNSIPFDIQSNISLSSIGFADKNNGWAVGCDYTDTDPAKYKVVVLHWNGESWKNFSLLDSIGRENFCLESIDVISNTNIWTVGQEYFIKGVTLHWDGISWKEIPSPEKMHYAHSISATSENNVWVSSANNVQNDYIFHWDGQEWSQMELPISFGLSYTSKTSAILAISQNNVWAGGRALFHWDGIQWNDALYHGESGNIVDIEMTSDGEIWALTDTGIILHINN